MQHYGHRLDITPVGDELVATCQCGRWRRTLPASGGKSLPALVAQLTGKHERHLGRVGRLPLADNASTDVLPTLHDEEPGGRR